MVDDISDPVGEVCRVADATELDEPHLWLQVVQVLMEGLDDQVGGVERVEVLKLEAGQKADAAQ